MVVTGHRFHWQPFEGAWCMIYQDVPPQPVTMEREGLGLLLLGGKNSNAVILYVSNEHNDVLYVL